MQGIEALEQTGYVVGGIVLLLILVILFLHVTFGPSKVTLVAQRRLYEQDKAEAEQRFEEAVQAEMARIRKT